MYAPTQDTPPPTTDDSDAARLVEEEAAQRSEVLDGLARLYLFLVAHPDVPIHSVRAHFGSAGDDVPDAAGRAEIDRIASILGTTPTGTTHYAAVVPFAPLVDYTATHISAEHWAKVKAASKARA